MMDLQEIKANRFKFLKKVYELSEGSTAVFMNMFEDVGTPLQMDRTTANSIGQYLIDEGLLEPRGLGGGIGISHYGIKEVEEAIENPNRGTEHFPSMSIINVQNMNNSVIQQNSPGAVQNVTFNQEEKADLKSFLEELKQSLEGLNLAVAEQNEILAEINTVEAQIDSPKPKSIILKESLKTMRSILESVAANVYTPVLLEKLNLIIGAFGGG